MMSLQKRAKPVPEICSERALLLGKLTEAVEAVLSAYRQQQKAMRVQDPRFGRFDSTIERLAVKARAARDTCWSHVKSHRC